MNQGLLILDSNCIGLLEDPGRRQRLMANASVAGLEIAFSEINLLEAVSSPRHIRERLLSTMLEVAPDAPILPWPPRLLREIGRAILDGRAVHEHRGPSVHDAILSTESWEELSQRTREFNSAIETVFSEMHAQMRREAQSILKEDKRAFDEVGLREFLVEMWSKSDLRQHVASVIWETVGLEGEPPIAELEKVPTWALHLDAEEVSLFQRTLVLEQPKRVHRMDLLQISYLGARGNRVLATGDLPLLDAAQAVISGRVPGARCISVDSLLE